jgi:hypothetical protein
MAAIDRDGSRRSRRRALLHKSNRKSSLRCAQNREEGMGRELRPGALCTRLNRRWWPFSLWRSGEKFERFGDGNRGEKEGVTKRGGWGLRTVSRRGSERAGRSGRGVRGGSSF